MKNRNVLLMSTAIAILAAIIAGTAIAQEGKEVIKIASKPELGDYLTSSDGRALYYFKKDSPGKSECTGPCAEKWPVYCYKTSAIDVSDGLDIKDFSFFFRSADGLAHLTYKGMPLYNYSGDQHPGDTKGQGVNGLWFVVRP